MKAAYCSLCLLMLAGVARAATFSCTIDGTGVTPQLVFGKKADCAITGKAGRYQLTTRKEAKFLLASCWRDGPGGDVAACVSAVVRHSQNKKLFDIGAYSPGSTSTDARGAWISVTWSD